MLAPRVIRYRRERWVTPDGRSDRRPAAGRRWRATSAPACVRFVLMQHVQGQVTVERLLAQLRALGVRIAKGQLVALLSARKDAFHAETDAILRGRAGDRALGDGRRHRGAPRRAQRDHARTSATTASPGSPPGRPKSRLNFLELLRAGHPDYVINAAAVAYMLERGVPEAIVAALLAHERQGFADEAAWSGAPGGARPRRRVSRRLVDRGAPWSARSPRAGC